MSLGYREERVSLLSGVCTTFHLRSNFPEQEGCQNTEQGRRFRKKYAVEREIERE